MVPCVRANLVRCMSRPAPAHENNFNLLRVLAAGLVIVSHGIELPTGLAVRDWAHNLTGFAFSWYAVSMFFAISGYLVLGSWERQPSLVAFGRNRVLRIWPGLLVMLVFSVGALGVLFSTLPLASFFTSPQTASYFFGSLSVFLVKYDLPGLFRNNPLPTVNGSLWTLRFEVLCYSVLALLGTLGLMCRKARSPVVLGLIAVSVAIVLAVPIAFGAKRSFAVSALYELGRLGLAFWLGAAVYHFRERVPLSLAGVALLASVAGFALGTSAYVPAASLALAYATFWIALVPNGRALRTIRSLPDYSYGLYIYAFPVQQALVQLMPQASLTAIVLLSFAVTLPFAALSWHLVEKPALGLKNWGAQCDGPCKAKLVASEGGPSV